MKTISLKQNKKGVSPIIATLLLIVIAVAAAVVTYAFVTGFIGTATAQSTQQGAMSIDTGTVTGTGITVYVRNTGTKSEVLGTAYVDNVLIGGFEKVAGTVATFDPAVVAPAQTLTLAPGATCTVIVAGTTWADGAAHTVKIVASDGTPVAYPVHS
jgi:flagellin-like protein